MTEVVPLQRKVLAENDRIAADLRARFREHGILCLNLISSPGSGKTSLLERTLESLPAGTRVAVITGDIQTDNDARRLARFGFPVKQISTARRAATTGGSSTAAARAAAMPARPVAASNSASTRAAPAEICYPLPT